MDRHVACLESILFHHPQSSIIIYSNSLPNGKFANYREMGLNVTVREYTITTLRQLVDGMPGQAWLEKYKQWETGRYFFSHLTDFLRFTLLYKYGGTYSDFDAIYVKSVADLDSAVGIDMAGGTECDYCLPGRYYLAPGVLVNFPAGSALLRESMRGFENYSMTCFNCVGPVAITLAARNYSNELTMLPPFFFYPLTYWDVKEWFSRRPRETLEWRKITRNAYSLHLYGFKTNKITPEPNSLVDQALRAFRVQCNRDLDKPLRVPEFIAFEDGHKPFSRVPSFFFPVQRLGYCSWGPPADTRHPSRPVRPPGDLDCHDQFQVSVLDICLPSMARFVHAYRHRQDEGGAFVCAVFPLCACACVCAFVFPH
jgi:hypothetical protein